VKYQVRPSEKSSYSSIRFGCDRSVSDRNSFLNRYRRDPSKLLSVLRATLMPRLVSRAR